MLFPKKWEPQCEKRKTSSQGWPCELDEGYSLLEMNCSSWISGFELVKQIDSQKISDAVKKKKLDLRISLWKMGRVLTKFCELISTNMYYEYLSNHVIQQGVFDKLKMTYCIASSMNDFKNSRSISF